MDFWNYIRERSTYYINLVFGSDTQTGATPAYVWLADQFGHIFIGFGGVFLLLWVVSWLSRRPLPSHRSADAEAEGRGELQRWAIWVIATFWLGLWTMKEFRDVALAAPQAQLWLEPSDLDLWADFRTDIAFYAIGVVLALAHFGVLFGLRPILVFPAMLVFAGILVANWIHVFDNLGKANIPHLARISSVNLVPDAPTPAVAEGAAPSFEAFPEQCVQYRPEATSNSRPVFQCTVRSGCGQTHFIIYGLTKAEMPDAANIPDTHLAIEAPSAQSSRPTQEHLKKVLPELRKLGIALIAERIFRQQMKDQDNYYTTLYSAFERTNSESFLVLDNIERDLTRYALSKIPRFNDDNFNNKLPVLEALFRDEVNAGQPGLIEELSKKNVVWLSLNEELAGALCRTLIRTLAERGLDSNSKRVIMVRATLRSSTTSPAAPRLASSPDRREPKP